MNLLCFATQNADKLAEIRYMFPAYLNLCTLADLGCGYELAEDHDSLRANALQKAQHIYDGYQVNCFADDSGLEVEALDGQPGVFSARYAGSQRNDTANINLLLDNLAHQTNRKAAFRTCIALIWQGEAYMFEGVCYGQIAQTKMGTNGFGYDPVFVPDNQNGLSFAQMSAEQKNKISHRGIAFAKLKNFFDTY